MGRLQSENSDIYGRYWTYPQALFDGPIRTDFADRTNRFRLLAKTSCYRTFPDFHARIYESPSVSEQMPVFRWSDFQICLKAGDYRNLEVSLLRFTALHTPKYFALRKFVDADLQQITGWRPFHTFHQLATCFQTRTCIWELKSQTSLELSLLSLFQPLRATFAESLTIRIPERSKLIA